MKDRNKSLVSKLKKKTEDCLKNRKNANCLVDILAHLTDDDPICVGASIKSVNKIFSHFLDIEEMRIPRTDSDATNEDKYKCWLCDRYKETVDRLLELLQFENHNVKEMAFTTLMRFIYKEGKHPISDMNQRSTLPVDVLKRVLTSFQSYDVSNQSLSAKLQEYLMYDDVRYFTLRHLQNSLNNSEESTAVSETYLENVYTILENLSMPSPKQVAEPLTNFMSKVKSKPGGLQNAEEHRRLFSEVWVNFLQFKLSSSLYRKVLIRIHDKVIPHMTNPLMLSDFLTVSYNIGGAISLLSLNGLFILIHKHNLEYPDFFKKLYALFDPTIFHAKYRSRFFYLSNLFLTSTHLPAYLVAAFAKRLSRISLTAPVVALKVVIPFIYNLINRHPVCKQLIHRPTTDGTEKEMVDDPYLPNEPDPAKCKAIDSCLWELKTLQEHYYPEVVYLARKIDNNLPELETDLSELLDTTADEIFDKECSKKIRKAPLNFEPPKGLFDGKEDRLKLCWTL